MDTSTAPRRASSSEWDTSEDLDQSETGELLEKHSNFKVSQHRLRTLSTSSALLTISNILILCITIFLVVFKNPTISEARIVIGSRAYTPVYQSVPPTLHTTTFNGSLFNTPPSLYRSDPSPEMSEEWERLATGGYILVTRSDILALGKDPATRSRASPDLLESMGLPPDGEYYHAMVDAFHQIHCLNEIRKHAYWDYYYAPVYGSWGNHTPHELHWTHISHCFEMLRQNLVCNADAGIITSVWMEGQPAPFPDFNLEKKCGDLEALAEWQEKRTIPEDAMMKFLGPETRGKDEILYDAPPELFAAKGVDLPEGRVVDHEVLRPKNWFSSW